MQYKRRQAQRMFGYAVIMQTSLFRYCLLVAKSLTNEIQARAIYCQIVQI